MLKKLNIVGLVSGVLIIIFSIVVFSYDIKVSEPSLSKIGEDISAPVSEKDMYYGGDAYTGMQQASAQAANNLIPVYEAVMANKEALSDYADNEVENIEAIASLVKSGLGFIVLSIGLLVISNSVEYELNLKKKKKEA